MGKKTVRNWTTINCPDCNGKGYTVACVTDYKGREIDRQSDDCDRCQGSGRVNVVVKDQQRS